MSIAKRKSFTLEEKARIIMRLENGETNISIGTELGVASSTIATMWKCRETIKNNFGNGEKSVRIKRMRNCNYEAVDELLLKWFKTQKTAIPGPVFQSKADELAKKLGIDHFKCSAGWIQRFRKRHAITCGKLSNETVPQEGNHDFSKNEDVFDEDDAARECKEKWKNIRTVFRRHLPFQSGITPKRTYYLNNELQFLVPIMASSPSRKPSASVVDNHSDMEILEVKVEDEELQEEQDPLENYASDVPSPQPEGSQFILNQKRRRVEEDTTNTFPAETNRYKTEETNRYKTEETNLNGSLSSEADEHFLLSLKWDLGEMNSKQKRLFKKGVYELIDKIMESES